VLCSITFDNAGLFQVGWLRNRLTCVDCKGPCSVDFFEFSKNSRPVASPDEAKQLITFFSKHLRLRMHALEESADVIDLSKVELTKMNA
jgi:hypothetical protein